MNDNRPKVWWVQCKPFDDIVNEKAEIEAFQSKCKTELLFGIGWKESGLDIPAKSEMNQDTMERLRKRINNPAFTHAQRLFGKISQGDVIFTRLNDKYYVGVVKRLPLFSSDERLTWDSKVESWVEIKDLPHHVRGKISSRKYQGTIAEVDGLSALTLIENAGISCEKMTIGADDFFEAIDDGDLEDLMAFYMTQQNPDFVFLPSSCKKNTPGIEYVMYDPKTNEKITCQTKVLDWIDVSVYSDDERYGKYKKIYLFAGNGYKGTPEDLKNIEIVDSTDLYDALKRNKYIREIVEKSFELDE